MSKEKQVDMILDVDFAHDHYCETVEKVSKYKYLKMIGMSWQTYGNLQKSKSRQIVMQFAQKIKDTAKAGGSEVSMDDLIKKL